MGSALRKKEEAARRKSVGMVGSFVNRGEDYGQMSRPGLGKGTRMNGNAEEWDTGLTMWEYLVSIWP